MPRVYFTITSISEASFRILTEGYHKRDDEVVENFTKRTLAKIKSFFGRELPKKQRVSPCSSVENTRAQYPVLDPQFLLFTMLIVGYLNKGSHIGHFGNALFMPYHDECSLGGISSGVLLWNGKYVLHREAHKYSVEVNDIPEYGRLKKLQQMTNDASLSALLNRLVLWLHLFVEINHYGWSIAVKHPKTNDLKILSNPFFLKFSKETAL